MREKLEYFLALSLIRATRLLPDSWIYSIFKNLAIALFYIDKKRRKLTIKNLGNLYHINLKKLAKENYIEVSKTIAESIVYSKYSPDKILSMIDDSDMQINPLSKDTQYLFITAHIGAWEILGYYFTLNGFKINVVTREGNNKLIEKNITLKSRERFGAKTIYKKKAGFGIFKAFQRGESVGVLIDQKAGHNNSVITTFFDKDVTTTNLIANLKLKFDFDVIPIFLVRKDKKFKLIIREKVDYIAQEFEDRDSKIVAMTQKYNDVLEDVIREYPMQWFWMHNRWKI